MTFNNEELRTIDIKKLKEQRGSDDYYVQEVIHDLKENSQHSIKFYTQTNEIGKLLLCESKEDNSTRVFIRRFSTEDIENKQGWWDIFTISNTTFKKGFHFCRIVNFRIDQNGHINMIVEPFHFLGEIINTHSYAWRVFVHKVPNEQKTDWENVFSRSFCDIQYASAPFLSHRYNSENISEQFGRDFKGSLDANRIVFDKFINGEITIEEIESILDEPTSHEKWINDVYNKIIYKDESFAEKYPLFVEKFRNSQGRSLNDFLNDQSFAYSNIYGYGEKNAILNDLEKAEKVFEYREIQKQAKKDAKKKARQDAKLAKAEQS